MLVALIREGLAKSTEVVAKAVRVRGVVRSALAEGSRPTEEDATARVPQPGEISNHAADRRTRNWRVAIVTGLLGFVVAAVFFTVPELVAGKSAARGDRGTTLFGGQQRESRTPVETTPGTTVPAKTVTTPPPATVTVPPQTVTTPPPAVTTPAQPQQPTTTAPPPAAEPLPPPEAP